MQVEHSLDIVFKRREVLIFRYHCKVVGRDGWEEYKMAALKKSIYSLSDVAGNLSAASLRYLDFIGTLGNRAVAHLNFDHISAPARDSFERSWRGFNIFIEENHTVLLTILRGEFTINELNNKRLRALLPNKTNGQIARILRRMRLHHLMSEILRFLRRI